MRGSPGLFWSIQPLIFGSLRTKDCVSDMADKGLHEKSPFVLLPHIVSLTQIDKICHGLSGEEGQGVDHVNLKRFVSRADT